MSGYTYSLGTMLRSHEKSPASLIYESQRYFPDGDPGSIAYAIPVPLGKYRVTLHFIEGESLKRGERVFDVLVESTIRTSEYEPLLSSGFGVPGVLAYDVEIADGVLNVDFRRRSGTPQICGIEVELK